MTTIMDLITEQQTVTAAAIVDLRERIGKLTDELRTAETELSDLATTRTTLTRLTSANEPEIPNDGPLDNTVYQQILTAFKDGDHPTLRAKDVCQAIGLGTEPKDTEGIRAKLKRLVKRGILTEIGAGKFVLTTPAEPAEQPAASPTSNPKHP
ncbi:hypothetical protein [Actinoplanes couchii]|uniref:Uncharacterized protein n=1 Tax=Actinoplanes couchii TaxID=403638 RepID=A0ABQ3XT32_9ACTN|nr:hypothetical protein [Actinoplanes couchii]MDR6324542.1 hypothetical protein [Actinoplanes couchii]GID61677.1 hypothetical protein Aco03nite_100810 [Actinoplanes couchii]